MSEICELYQRLADYYFNANLCLVVLVLVQSAYILYQIYEEY